MGVDPGGYCNCSVSSYLIAKVFHAATFEAMASLLWRSCLGWSGSRCRTLQKSQSHIDIVSFKLLLLVLLNPTICNYRSAVQFFSSFTVSSLSLSCIWLFLFCFWRHNIWVTVPIYRCACKQTLPPQTETISACKGKTTAQYFQSLANIIQDKKQQRWSYKKIQQFMWGEGKSSFIQVHLIIEYLCVTPWHILPLVSHSDFHFPYLFEL